jgi:ion channel
MSASNELRLLRERWRDPLLTALTFLLTFTMFVLLPLEAEGFHGAQDLGFVIVVLVIGAAVVLSGNPVAIVMMAAGLAFAIVAYVVRLQEPSTLDVCLKSIAWILMGVFLMWVVARAVFAPGAVTYQRVLGAILLYLTLGWSFVGVFTLVGLLVPNAFAGFTVSDSPALASTMVYFSFGTLTTAGSGAIAPLHPMARSFVNLEAMIGQLYPATVLARLVTLEIAGGAKH